MEAFMIKSKDTKSNVSARSGLAKPRRSSRSSEARGENRQNEKYEGLRRAAIIVHYPTFESAPLVRIWGQLWNESSSFR